MDAYERLRPLLFRLDPERAHALAGRLLGLAPAVRIDESRVEVMGLEFPNRVGLAAGFDKNAEWLRGLGRVGFGFVEVGTVTPRPQSGNPRPRLFRLPAAEAVINRMGFNNAGLAAFERRLRARPSVAMRVGANIGKNRDTPNANAVDDYLSCYRAVVGHADFVTVNVSSPNTEGLRDLQGERALQALLEHLLDARAALGAERTPLLVKCAPDLDAHGLDGLARVVERTQLDGVVATNTTTSRRGVAGQRHADEAGGLSGVPLHARALEVVSGLRARLGDRIALVGVGGIHDAASARAMRAAGADLVQMYTGLIYRGPALVHEVRAALADAKA